jgi:hypothetical protein
MAASLQKSLHLMGNAITAALLRIVTKELHIFHSPFTYEDHKVPHGKS